MSWAVTLSKKADKQQRKLPETIRETVALLTQDLALNGPSAKGWPHAGKLTNRDNEYHCHLKRGRPTYVAVWTADKASHKIEVTYVGTHENAPY